MEKFILKKIMLFNWWRNISINYSIMRKLESKYDILTLINLKGKMHFNN